jgi:hypothetical protein
MDHLARQLPRTSVVEWPPEPDRGRSSAVLADRTDVPQHVLAGPGNTAASERTSSTDATRSQVVGYRLVGDPVPERRDRSGAGSGDSAHRRRPGRRDRPVRPLI